MDRDLRLVDDEFDDSHITSDDLVAEGSFETDAAAILGDTVIELTDEDGNLQEFQVLDVIEQAEATYYVLIDADDEEDELSEVFVLRVVEDEDEPDLSAFEAVDDDEAHAIFELFRERNAEFFNFVDLGTDK